MFTYAPGATPIDLDEASGLIPSHITLQNQLNEWEQANILEAEQWVSSHHFTIQEISTSTFVKKIHLRMFNNTWNWAGKYRQSNKNIGIDYLSIAVQLKVLLDDLHYQVQHKTYLLDETAARFHHRLVSIHPFCNGNGRLARLMADIVLMSQGYKRFSWGRYINLIKPIEIRTRYIHALRMADQMDYSWLLDFVRQ